MRPCRASRGHQLQQSAALDGRKEELGKKRVSDEWRPTMNPSKLRGACGGTGEICAGSRDP